MDLNEILKVVEDIGYKAEEFEQGADTKEKEIKKGIFLLAFSLILTIPIILIELFDFF